jgi:hypothetical protein
MGYDSICDERDTEVKNVCVWLGLLIGMLKYRVRYGLLK